MDSVGVAKAALDKHGGGDFFLSLDAWSNLETALRMLGADHEVTVPKKLTVPAHMGECGVYLLHAEGTNRYKIGWSKCVNSRVDTLQTGCPYPINVIIVMDSTEDGERWLHRRFAQYRVCGEWFELPEEIVTWLASLKPATTGTLQDA